MVVACGNDPIGRECTYISAASKGRRPQGSPLASRHEENFDNLGLLLLVFALEKYLSLFLSLSLALSLMTAFVFVTFF